MAPRDEEDEAEISEEDEDFNGEGQESDPSPKKSKKRKGSKFIDDAASDDEVRYLLCMFASNFACYGHFGHVLVHCLQHAALFRPVPVCLALLWHILVQIVWNSSHFIHLAIICMFWWYLSMSNAKLTWSWSHVA